MIINLSKGKTECMLKYRGKHAHKFIESRLVGKDFKIRLPNAASAEFMNVVSCYKHLDSQTCADGSVVKEVNYRSSQAMSRYRPLVPRAFSSTSFSQQQKIRLAESLVSTLFFNVHVWTNMTPASNC